MAQNNDKPKRWMFSSRNAYRGALRDWTNFWKKWRAERKRDKKSKTRG